METGYGHLMHSAKGSTWSKKEHKYLTREWKDGKWVYYYSNKKQGTKKRIGRQQYVYEVNGPQKTEKQHISQVLRHGDDKMREDYGYLLHSAKGSTWSKSGAKYDKRYWKNGKWYYVYGEKMKKKAKDDEWRRNQREKLLKEGEQHRHEQYLKDQEVARNRERQAKILKGKTGGVVNANHHNITNAKAEQRARVNHLGYEYINGRNDMKNNAKRYKKSHEYDQLQDLKRDMQVFADNRREIDRAKKIKTYSDYDKVRKINFNEGRTNTSKGGYIYNDKTGKYEYKLKPKDWKAPDRDEFIEAQRKGNDLDLRDDWNAKLNSYYSEKDYHDTSKRNKRLSDAADRAAKTKKLNSKSYQLKNKASGKVKTIKKKIKG